MVRNLDRFICEAGTPQSTARAKHTKEWQFSGPRRSYGSCASPQRLGILHLMNTRPWLIAAVVVFGLSPDRAEESLLSLRVEPPVQDTLNAAKTCGMCHTTIYEEWKDRKHNLAWDDEIYQ